MLSQRVKTGRNDSQPPASLFGAAVASLCAGSVVPYRWTGRIAAPVANRLVCRRGFAPMWVPGVILFAVVACLWHSSVSAQDHVNRPVKKRWWVANSQQHAPPTRSVAGASIDAARESDGAIIQANHNFSPGDAGTEEPSGYSTGLPDESVYAFPSDDFDCACGGGCDSPLCDTPSYRGCGNWISVDYLNWTTSGGDLPPLVRSSPNGPPQQTGIIGQPGDTLFGGSSDDFTESGIRIGGGWWFDDRQMCGVEIIYSGLPSARESVLFDSSSFPRLGRPVFDTVLGAESAMLVAHPDFLTGRIAIEQTSEFHHIELLRRDMQFQNACRRIDSLIGLRYASMEDSLFISQSSLYTAAQGPIIAGTRRDLFDRFEASNRFQGLVLGLDYTETIGVIGLHARGTLGVGNNRTEVVIDGQTATSVPGGGADTFDGGLLAQTTNIGTYSKNRFVVMPEVFLGVSARFNYGWEVKAGYQLIYWSDAAQSANQIDRRVSQFPPEPPAGVGAPTVLMDSGGVLIHGLQTGLSLTF